MQKNIQKYRRQKICTKTLAPGKNSVSSKNLADGKNLVHAKNLADGKNLAACQKPGGW
jgi:hypothetical protein